MDKRTAQLVTLMKDVDFLNRLVATGRMPREACEPARAEADLAAAIRHATAAQVAAARQEVAK